MHSAVMLHAAYMLWHVKELILCTDGEEDGEDFLTLQDRERILETGRWVSFEHHREKKI